MLSKTTSILTALAATLLAAPGALFAQGGSAPTVVPLPFVNTLFGDNMVLQRGKPDALWGWSDPGDTIRVQFEGGMGTDAFSGVNSGTAAEITPIRSRKCVPFSCFS